MNDVLDERPSVRAASCTCRQTVQALSTDTPLHQFTLDVKLPSRTSVIYDPQTLDHKPKNPDHVSRVKFLYHGG